MKILVISPHPDDELIGIGGTLLKRKVEGNEIGWLIMTEMSEKDGWNPKQIDIRQKEINSVRTMHSENLLEKVKICKGCPFKETYKWKKIN